MRLAKVKATAASVQRRLDALERAANAKDAGLAIESRPAAAGGLDVRLRHVEWDRPHAPAHETVTLELSDLELLGSAGGRSYLRHGEREVRVDRAEDPVALHDTLRPDQVFVHEVRMVKGGISQVGEQLVPSVDHEEDRWYRATLLPAGSYAAAQAREARLAAERQPQRTSVLSARPHGWPVGRELLDWLPRHGIDLAVVNGALDVSTTRRTPILDLFRTAIADHAALLVGWLTDAPVTCWRTGCGAEAVTVRLAGEAACSEHAQ